MLANVRNRLAVIAAVEPYSQPEQLHWVRVEYLDQDGPAEDQLLWEREPNASVWPPSRLPDLNKSPMSAREFDAFVRATRWSATTPFAGPAANQGVPTLVAPLYGAVQIEDFQLVPLFEALRMPRVALLLADDVGLGKTIEAGLILSELLIRRRIRRILIICPASLRFQWQQEMQDKFSLGFDVIDRAETLDLQKRLGLDTNPWRAYPRVIASYHYLKQPDILQQFLATCRQPETGTPSAQLPWDLLVVDEAHNLTPAHFGSDSDLALMLRRISPHFEHRLFLTATPHNGYTRSFTGLLQQLDPVRFQQSAEVDENRVKEVVIRRLKREIREADRQAGRPERFGDRDVQPVPLFFGAEERALSRSFSAFRKALLTAIGSQPRGEQMAGRFAIEILNKRLLSCPFTFADSWLRFKEGTRDEERAETTEVRAAQTIANQDNTDDREREERSRHAAKTVGAWLKPWLSLLSEEIAAIDESLSNLGLNAAHSWPRFDERYERLKKMIRERIRDGSSWRNDERLIVFTEYKTSLDYLKARLEQDFRDNGNAIRILFGDPSARENRQSIIKAFNDPADPVRVLVATDVASEGINLQETARLLLHFDIPWNPARLEQRNGRLDRHGQARDVTVYHFASDDDADVRFCARVAEKVNEIREDLGSVEEVLDAAFQRHFHNLENAESVLAEMDAAVETAKGRASVARDMSRVDGSGELARLSSLREELDLSPESLRSTLEVALGLRLEGPDERMRFQVPLTPSWRSLIDETLRVGDRGQLRGVVFDPRLFVTTAGTRPVFRPMKDTVLLHLGHALFRRSLATFARKRYPGTGNAEISRWCVRRGVVPTGADALILLTVEELAANELRQPFHHWISTLRVPVRGISLEPVLEHVPASKDDRTSPPNPADQDAARDLWLEIEPDVTTLLKAHAESCRSSIQASLTLALQQGLHDEKERFRSRKTEVRRQLSERSIARLTREVEDLRIAAQQLHFDPERTAALRIELHLMEEELDRRTRHDNDLLAYLEREEKRVLEYVVPQRFKLRGDVQVFPVAVEIRFPEKIQ
jgi:superfamily II DNA or RNA helicase